MNATAAILPILFLAFLAESLTEYLAKPLLDLLGGGESGGERSESPDSAKQSAGSPIALRYVACLVGIGLALAYRVDVLAVAGLRPAWPWVGHIITGLIIGRGSNYLNDLADRWL